MSRLFSCFLLVLSISGCATYSWYHPYKGTNEFNQDKYTCIQQSAQAFPVVVKQSTYGTGYTSPSHTTCSSYYGQMNCTTTPGTYVPPVTSSVDVNEGNRTQAFNSCMIANGWSLRKDNGSVGNEYSMSSSMECLTNADCRDGESCRSKKGGGTECRLRQN